MLATTLIGRVDGPLGAGPQAIALRGARLVAVDADGDAAISDADADGRWRRARTRSLSITPGRLALSHSGRFLLARSPTRDRALVHDLESGRMVLEIAGSAGVTNSAVAALATAGERELVLFSTVTGELQGRMLPDGDAVVDVAVPPFVFLHLVTVGGDDTVIALGYYLSEGRDSLLTFSTSSLLADASTAQRVVNEQPGISDYAYSLAVGPCGPDALVVYRDPEDEEQPDEDEEPEDVPPHRSDVYGLRGLYMRRLDDGALFERLPASLDIATGAELFATATAVVVGHIDRVEVLDRGDLSRAPLLLGSGAYGLDPWSGRIATVTPDGAVEIHGLT